LSDTLRKKSVFFLLSLFAWLVFVGCTQRETSIGSDAAGPPSEAEFDQVAVACTQDTVWHPKISNGLGLSLQWGDAGNFHAVCLLRFLPSSVLPDSFRLDSNRLVLRGAATLPEGTFPPGLATIWLITDPWSEDTVRLDNLPGYETFPLLENLPMSAEATDSFEVHLPDSLVEQWASDDTLNWGIWIEPQDTAEFLREFYSGEWGIGYAPALFLYGAQYDTNDEGQWEESGLDTFVSPEDDAYLVWDRQLPIDGRMMLTQGLSQRFLLYFSLESVFPDYGVSVVHAEFSLWADNVTDANFGSVSLFKHGTLKTDSWRRDLDSTETDQVSIASSPFDADNEVVVFDVTSVVSHWIQNPGTNTGFFVAASGETQALGRRVFYNRFAEDTTSVPELRIWYLTAY
jgi:hypothetical protein